MKPVSLEQLIADLERERRKRNKCEVELAQILEILRRRQHYDMARTRQIDALRRSAAFRVVG